MEGMAYKFYTADSVQKLDFTVLLCGIRFYCSTKLIRPFYIFLDKTEN